MFSTLAHLWRRAFFLFLRIVAGGSTAARYLGVRVGSDCRILTKDFGSEPWLITIGDRVTITAGVVLLTHDGSSWLFRDAQGRRYRYAPINIGNDVFIGIGSILMPGVCIGDRVVVGAGSVVTKSIPSGLVVAGNPARVLGRYDDLERQALTGWKSERDRKGGTFREQVDGIVEREPRPAIRTD